MPVRPAHAGAVLAALLAIAPSLAAAEEPPFSDLPPPLLERLNRDISQGAFVEQLLQELRRGDVDRNGLSQADIDFAERIRVAQYRAMLLAQTMMADLDGDGSVAKAEAVQLAVYQTDTREGDAAGRQQRIDHTVERIMTTDSDGDGIVTMAEVMASAPDQREGQRESERLAALLEFDADRDGSVSAPELQAAAVKTFQAVDYDHDGMLTKSELKLLEPARRQARALQSAMPCDLPPPGPSDLVAILGTNSGALQPTVTVTGQAGPTQLTIVTIEAGDPPLYLLLSSLTPMIWQFEGATERIARAVVVRAVDRRGSNMTGAGVIGLPGDKVTFLPARSCGQSFARIDSEQARIMAQAVARKIGRAPDKIIAGKAPLSLGVPSGREQVDDGTSRLRIGNAIFKSDGSTITVEGQGPTETPAPGIELLQAESWSAPVEYLRQIDAATVLAPGKVEPYEILPGYYGLRQLVEEGKLERTADGYRILGPIAHFPPNLDRGGRITFLLPDGTPMPGGDAGAAQIILERPGTGQPAPQ
ncbi:MAG TPA: hypothetical protein PLR41_00475 [Alphaproteobacteria bacterium]|nr:hypothetical protein [Alphaproteobacteria bacterium]